MLIMPNSRATQQWLDLESMALTYVDNQFLRKLPLDR
jgi:hypothetical protein